MRSFAVLLALFAPWSLASARPLAPSALCAQYPEAPDCRGTYAECSLCHRSTWPATWNAYGMEIVFQLDGEDLDADTLAPALAAIEELDSDGDGVRNLDELLAGTNPGDETDAWPYCAPDRVTLPDLPVAESYDFRRAARRAGVLYCGRSPSYDELHALDAMAPAERYQALHTELERCLGESYWRDRALHRLADERVRPISSVGADSPVDIVIGDYEWDYRLFSHVLTDDRDARDLLLADYHVDEDGDVVRGAIPGVRAGTQPLVPEERAGMITTQWFLSVNTMFSPLPRTTAAQAYRAYLGFDIAQQQGIVPIPGEPLDVDDKGVDAPECAGCHSTLDPLSYAFAEYEGIRGARTGTFDASRPVRVIDGWSEPASAVFGEEVESVRVWAERAAESEAFRRNLVMLFFRHAFEREPTPGEQADFDAIVAALPGDGHSANRLIHRLVDLDAFGGVQ